MAKSDSIISQYVLYHIATNTNPHSAEVDIFHSEDKNSLIWMKSQNGEKKCEHCLCHHDKIWHTLPPKFSLIKLTEFQVMWAQNVGLKRALIIVTLNVLPPYSVSPLSLVSEGLSSPGLETCSPDMAGDLYSPPSPLGDSLLDSPLCGDLMEDLRDISQSIGGDTLGFDFPEYQSTGSGSESSIALGE